MAIALGGQADSNTAGTTGAVTITPSAGALIVVCFVIRNGGAFTSVTDNRSQTYTAVTTPLSSGAARVGMHFFPNCASGSTTITVTGASDTYLVNGSWWTGAATSSVLNGFDTSINGAGTSHPHGATGVGAAAGDLIVTVAGQSATITNETVATNYTALTLATGGNNRQWWQYRLASGTLSGETAAYTATSHSSVAMIASFLAAAAAGNVGRRPFDSPIFSSMVVK